MLLALAYHLYCVCRFEAHVPASSKATAPLTVVSGAVLPSTARVAACSMRRTSSGSRAAAGGRLVWRGACASRAGVASCSPVAVHAAPGGASSEGVSQPDDIGECHMAPSVMAPAYQSIALWTFDQKD